jgi:hypothetical protein
MINLYQTWKDDKDSEPKKNKNHTEHKCILCGKSVNGLKDHMDNVHGKGTYKRYVSVEEQHKERRRQQLIKIMRHIK